MYKLYDLVKTKECRYIKPVGSVGQVIGPIVDNELIDYDGLIQVMFLRTIRVLPLRGDYDEWQLLAEHARVYVNINDLEPAKSYEG